MRILIVDDDPLVLQTLQAILEAEGHSVTASSGGQEGLDAFKLAQIGLDPFGLVITDAGMPNVDGYRVVTVVKEISPSTPVIMFTGSPKRSISRDDDSFQEDLVLAKPPNMRELRAAVARFAHS